MKVGSYSYADITVGEVRSLEAYLKEMGGVDFHVESECTSPILFYETMNNW